MVAVLTLLHDAACAVACGSTATRTSVASVRKKYERLAIYDRLYSKDAFACTSLTIDMLQKFTKNLFRKQAGSILTPRQLYGEVFDAVQLSRALLDGKTFVDCIPRYNPNRIVRTYKREHAKQVSAAQFVRDNFILPQDSASPQGLTSDTSGRGADIRAHIELMWDVLTREADTVAQGSSLLPLPYRYIVPGGRFREIYYWDSYYTMLGLKESGRIDLIEDMVKNFAHLIMTYGFIPNGNRSYYMTRSQPPMFAHMVALLAEIKGEAIYRTYLPALVKEYEFWMHGAHDAASKRNKTNAAEHVVRMPDGEILNRFFDSADTPREEGFAEDVEAARHVENPKEFYRNMRAGAESGWDYSSRWFEEGGNRDTIRIIDIVPVDLNALMVMVEEIIATAYQSAGKTEQAEKMQEKAEARAEALRKYFWNEERGWFCDYLSHEKKQSPSLSLAGMFPLFAGVATQAQADATAAILMQQFLRPGGLATTLVTSGEQWDAPNGWAPLHYVAVMGLERYGYTEHAKDIAGRWCKLNIAAFETTGALLEKYNVEDPNALATGGEYALQDGFGWTNGVLLTLMNRYGIEETAVPSPVAETVAVTP